MVTLYLMYEYHLWSPSDFGQDIWGAGQTHVHGGQRDVENTLLGRNSGKRHWPTGTEVLGST